MGDWLLADDHKINLMASIADLFDQHTTVANKIAATITQVITRISHQSNLKHEYSSELNSCFKKLWIARWDPKVAAILHSAMAINIVSLVFSSPLAYFASLSWAIICVALVPTVQSQ